MVKIGSDLYIGGAFISAANTNIVYVAKLNRQSNIWEQVGNGLNGPVSALGNYNNQLVIGGAFTNAGGNPNANHIAMLVGNIWTNFGAGISGGPTCYRDSSDYPPPPPDGEVWSLASCGKNLFAGGNFTTAGYNTNANGIAVWNGTEWQSIGNGLYPLVDPFESFTNLIVNSIVPRGNSIFVGGQFGGAWGDGTNQIKAYNIAQATWNESQQTWIWSDLDLGLVNNVDSEDGGTPDDPIWPGYVYNMAIVNGPTSQSYDLYVGGGFYDKGSSEIEADDFFSYTTGFTRWRVGYPKPPSVPTVAITYPLNNAVFTTTNAFNIIATATSTYTNVASVDFFVDNQYLETIGNDGSDNVYTYSWGNPTYGIHLLKAVATDAAGLTGESQPVIISIKNPANSITAVNDFYTMPEGTLIAELHVLTNDIPSTGLKISGIVQPHQNLGTVSISPDKSYLKYNPLPNVYGTDIFYYDITNSSGAIDSAAVTVLIRPLPFITLFSPQDGQAFSATANVTVSGNASDSGGAVTNISLFVNGMLYSQTTNNSFSYNWSNNVPAFYTFFATATDDVGVSNSSFPVTISITNASTATNVLTAQISNLPTTTAGFGITNYTIVRNGLYDLNGQARDSKSGDLVAYQLLLRPPGDPDTIIANVTPQPIDANGFHQGGDIGGYLGNINLTAVPNGIYDLELIVHGGGGRTNITVTFQLDSQLKIGQFSFSEQDMVIPVNGIPLTVIRTYNSLNPSSSDFGYSWSFALNDMDIQLDESREDVQVGGDNSFNTDTEDNNNLPHIVSMRDGGGWDVTLTLPNGQITTFTFSLSGNTAKWTPPSWVHATLTPRMPGSDTIITFLALFWLDTSQDGSYNDIPFENQDFPGWILTTQPDGTQYYITRGNVNNLYFQNPVTSLANYARVYGPPKLTQIVERNTNSIVIADNGIFHYNATNALTRSILFDRDSQGRIIDIRDPNAGTNGLPSVQYVYDQDNGNLLQVLKLVDRNAGTYTTNKYDYNNPNFPHYITSIENGDGVSVARNYYDNSGRLTAVEDPDGNQTQFFHNLTNKMEVVIDRLNHTNTYIYDLNGNVTAQTNALGQIKMMAYDANNNKTNEIAFLNGLPYATNNYVYDPNNLLLSSTDPLGHASSYSYDGFGDVLISMDARGNSLTNAYDGNTGNLITTGDALGNTTTNFYDGNSLLLGTRDAIGTITTNYYDGNENLIATAALSASGMILSSNSFAYDANGNRTNSVAWRRNVSGTWVGAATTCIYDAQNRIIHTINPDGGTNIVVYNNIGKQSATVDPLGHTTTYTYDNQGRPFQTVYSDTNMETSIYDANGNRTNSVDRAGRITTYVYDLLNRLQQTIYADNTTNMTVYDDIGRVKFNIDARGVTNAFGYDAAGRRLTVTNALGVTSITNISIYSYDANGNQITFTDPLAHTTTNVFDALNRQVQVQFFDGTKSSTGYDADGRRVTQTNQDGLVTKYGYDGAGRLSSVTDALNQITRYQYDEAGNETAQIDALNRTNTYGYDSMGRRIQHIMPGNQTESFGYDYSGNLTYQTNFNNVIVTNQYDAMNRLTYRSSVNGYKASFAYSPTGQRTNMVDASGTNGYSYDNRDRLTNRSVTLTGGPGLMTLSYRYDANGNLTNLWSGTLNGVTNFYQYDPLNRLTNVIGRDSVTAGYTFDGAGNLLTVDYGNGVTNLYQYDRLNRLTNAVWKLNTTTTDGFYYTLNLSGVRTNLAETVNGSRNYTWQYDNLYRLTNENISGTVLSYGYDAVGNRTNRTSSLLGNQTPTYNTNDWINGDVYDSNGNTRTNASSQPYFYDALNELTNFNNGAVIIGYDGDGNRVSKKVGAGTTTYYLVDDRNPTGYAQVMEEYQGSLTAVYTYGLDLVSQRRSGTVSYYIYDGHGSVRALVGTSGTVTDTYQYDAYGTKLSTSMGGTANNYLYTGEQFDSDLGFYYLRARYYKSDTGRFWTMDTYQGDISDPLSLHKYLYGEDNPVNMIDPSGHDDIGELLTTMTIDSGLASMVMPAVINAGGHAIASLIPQSVDQKLSSSVPDAVEFGGSVSGNLPIGKYPVGITGGGGIECLVSPKTSGAALYGYAGGGLSFGANTASAGVQGTFGFVFDTPTSQNYTKHFITLSLPYMALPANVRSKIDGFMASGFGATVGGSSQEFIQEAQSLGVQFSGVVNKGSVNVFWDPLGGGSCGVTFSKGIASTPNASSNFTATYSYYWQLLPHDDQAVSFR